MTPSQDKTEQPSILLPRLLSPPENDPRPRSGGQEIYERWQSTALFSVSWTSTSKIQFFFLCFDIGFTPPLCRKFSCAFLALILTLIA